MAPEGVVRTLVVRSTRGPATHGTALALVTESQFRAERTRGPWRDAPAAVHGCIRPSPMLIDLPRTVRMPDSPPIGPVPDASPASRERAVPPTTRTLFDPGRNCRVVASAGRAVVLVDAEDYFLAFARSALRATRSILIVGWDFDSRTPLFVEGTMPGVPPRLGEFLNYLVKRRRGLHVHVLNWDYPMVFGTDRETRPLYGFGWSPRRRVHLHYDNTHPVAGSHHQKIVVIDDVLAFSGGLDLTCRRWDTCDHAAEDPRRVVDGKPYPPFHDVMALVDGEAAAALADVARERWLRATGESIDVIAGAGDPWPPGLRPDLTDVAVGLSRTVPKTELTAEVREVEALYLDMIAAARRSLYIENQYFTSDRIGAALAARLAEPDPPEIVLVTRLLSHGWLEEHTMHVLRTRLVKRLREADRHGRFQVYYPHVPGLADGTCVDVHSKVMIVDDEWLRVGSANLSNRSMGFDTECDLTFEARGEPRLREAIAGLRDRLLAEHLGVEAPRVRTEIEHGGSMHRLIATLGNDRRSLRVLDDLPEWSDTVINVASVADPEHPVSLDQLIDQFSPDITERPRGPAWGKIGAIAVVVAMLAAAWRWTPLSELITAERIGVWADMVGGVGWAPVALILAYVPAAFTLFPRPLLTLFAVIAFGPLLGFAYAMSGIVASALATYFTGRAMPRDTVRRLAGDRVTRMSEILRKRGMLAVLAVRIVPVAPFAIEGMVAGAVRIRLWDYTAGTVLGMLPGTLTTTVFGDQLQNALEDPSRINWLLVAGVALLFVVLILAVRRWFKRVEHDARQAHAAIGAGLAEGAATERVPADRSPQTRRPGWARSSA